MSDLQKPVSIGVIGAGTMGCQIASLFAFMGHHVLIFDVVAPRNLTQIVGRWQRFLGRDETLVSKRISSKGTCLPATSLAALSGCNLIIECIAEDLSKKIALLRQVETVVDPNTVLATNTSSLSVKALASSLSRPSRFIGLHFFNPIHAVPLVEMCPAQETPTHLTAELVTLLEGMGRTVVVCPDTPGFIVNQLLFLMIAAAIQLLDQNSLSPASVDEAMRKGANMPLGPLELADLIGLDVCLLILKTLHERTSITSYAPPRRLEELVAAGHVGRKSGRGFYSKGG